jgi:TusA-related sulfurtransferase
MSDINIVDARGLSCPEPALLATQVIKKMKKGIVEVLVDSGTARENISRLAKNAGWSVTIEEQAGGNVKIVLQK